jgi:hypothetical protein
MGAEENYLWAPTCSVPIENAEEPHHPAGYCKGVLHTHTVLTEAMLLALTEHQICLGDDVIILNATSRTGPFAAVKFTNREEIGWERYTILGSGLTSGGGIYLQDISPDEPWAGQVYYLYMYKGQIGAAPISGGVPSDLIQQTPTS